MYSSATLGGSNLRSVARLPPDEDPNEWIAVNITDFFNQVSMLYGTLTGICTIDSCPKMSAGSRMEYLWTDGRQNTLALPAPTYIDYLLSWVHDQMDDEQVFPSQIGKVFPPEFRRVAETVMKRLFRVYAHIYHHHMDAIDQMKAVQHFNTSFKHFVVFVQEFNLIEAKHLAPLQDLIDRLAPTNNPR